jgi:hypothetical protein
MNLIILAGMAALEPLPCVENQSTEEVHSIVESILEKNYVIILLRTIESVIKIIKRIS